ncbi:RICIN domain-containing protein [Streptomyces sp. SYSU K217416]
MTLTSTMVCSAWADALVGRDVPQTVDIYRGATAEVPWTYQNTGGTGIIPAGGSTMVFQAPERTTFAAQSSVTTAYSADGQSWVGNNLGLRNCQLSNNNRTLSCEAYGLDGLESDWPSNSYFQFRPRVTVDQDAPNSALLAGGGRFAYYDRQVDRQITVDDGTLHVNVPLNPNAKCVVARKDAKFHDPVTLWKCNEIDNTVYASDWSLTNNELQSTDNASSTPMCAASWFATDRVETWPCASEDNRRVWDRQGLTLTQRETGKCMDAGSARSNGDTVTLQACVPGDPNQRFSWYGNKLLVDDTR